MNEPSVRMKTLVDALVNDALEHERNPNKYALEEFKNSKHLLLNAIEAIEQRAEKAEAEVKDMSRFLSTAKLEALCTKLFGCDKAAWWLGGENAPFIEKALHRIEFAESEAARLSRLLTEHIAKYRTLPSGADCQFPEIEASRNKWKRVAVAQDQWESAVIKCGSGHDYYAPETYAARDRARWELEAAIEALGDEWTEAVK